MQNRSFNNRFVYLFFPQFVGFLVGLVPQIRGLLIGDASPLHVLQDTAVLVGYIY